MKVHERIRNHIDNNGLKMNHVAEKSNIELKRFYRIINGDSIMSADEFEVICGALNVDAQYFFKERFLETKKISA